MEAFALADHPCDKLAAAIASAVKSDATMYRLQDDAEDDGAGFFPTFDQDGLQQLLHAASSSKGLRAGYEAVAEAVKEALEFHPEAVSAAVA